MPNKNEKPNYFSIEAKGDKAVIHLYDDVGGWDGDALYFKQQLEEAGDVSQIDLHINSPGGSVFEGLAIYNQLKAHPAKITVYIDGLAASMASYIAMVGDTVVMPENAIMMIHNPHGGAYGESKDMAKAQEVLDIAKKSMLSAYVAKSGLSEEEVSALMDAESWMTGVEAVEYGFADTLEPAVEMAASVRVPMPKASHISNILNVQPQPAVAGSTKKEGDMPNPKADATVDQTVDIEAIKAKAMAEALQKEETRRNEVKAAFAGFENTHANLLADCLADGQCDKVTAQAKLLQALGANEQPLGRPATIVEAEEDKAKVGMTSAIMARAGLAEDDRANNFRGMTLLEMARKSLQLNGLSSHGGKREVVAAAFTSTSDFPAVLEDVTHKALLKGYEEANETFQQFTTEGSIPDFKPVSRSDIGTFGNLQHKPEGAEYKTVSISDRKETMQLATYGMKFGITREAIINDDLGAFTRIPAKLGRAAIRTIGDLVYAVLTANPKMADGKALFHNDHKNLGSGALSTQVVDQLRVMMAKQKDGNATLNIRPAYLVVPTALRGLAMQVMEAEFEVSGNKDKTVPNYVRNLCQVIDDARLDASSTDAFYMLADQGQFDTIEVAYLDGQKTPYLEQQHDWNTDGVEFKVRMDAGVKALDWRTMVKSTGI